MSNIRFASPEHRDFFLDMMGEARRNDCYHRAFFYVMGIAPETRANIGSMFSDLCKYESEDFYREHKTIRFDTLDSFGEYEVIAAFKTVAYSEEGFKYYHFVNAESAEAFDEFIAKCKELALYDTDVSAEYGDQLITLSTCEYSRTNGRMVVVAKLLEE